jgi:hypothetical protein
MKTTTNQFALRLMPLPDVSDPHGHRRLRMACKTLRRKFGLRCIDVREAESTAAKESGRLPVEVGGAHEPAIGTSSRDTTDQDRLFAEFEAERMGLAGTPGAPF